MEVCFMCTMGAVKCVTTVFLVGLVLGCIGQKFMHKDDKCMKKKAKRAIRNIENIVDDIQYMFK